MKCLCILIVFLPAVSFSQTIKYRTYENSRKYQYKLITETYRNNQFASKAVSISSHKVVRENRTPSEEITWLRKTLFTMSDTVNLDTLAERVQPYRISLSPEGKVSLPELSYPGMVGEITDLNTFFVAVSPALQAQKLSRDNRQLLYQELLRGDFADSVAILFGRDCLQVTQTLIETNEAYTIIETTFTPPDTFCLTQPLLDAVAAKTFDEYNNFQMIRTGEGEKVNVFWGIETFKIATTLSNLNGQIIQAVMDNNLTLQMRYNASKDLTSYVAEMPLTIRRTLTLELLE